MCRRRDEHGRYFHRWNIIGADDVFLCFKQALVINDEDGLKLSKNLLIFYYKMNLRELFYVILIVI